MRRRDDKFPDNGFEAWGGYMNAKIAKLEEQFSSRVGTEKTSNILNGVSIYVNGYTTPSADELKVLMAEHGGVYHTYQRNEDYIIASNLPDTKVKNMSLSKVVKPEWITDSIKSNCLLDYREYLLYKNSKSQPRLQFNKAIKSKISLNSVDPSRSTIIKDNITHKEDISVKPEKEMDALSKTDIVKEGNEISCNHGQPFVPFECVKPMQTNSRNIINEQTTKTAVDPNFISEFYNNSRLHHISQLGACFKQHVNDLRENSNFQFPLREQVMQKIRNMNNSSPINFQKGKTIMHIDMDCFFVSVGLRNRPDLRGKPVAVTHSKGGQPHPKRAGVDRNTEFNLYRQKVAKKLEKAGGNTDEVEFETRVDNITDEDDKYGSMSEIASCSYEARAKGVSNGMFMGSALKLCPDIQTIQYDFEGYKEVAYTLYNTVAQYTLDIEAVSCDEMYVDCTELLKEMNVSVQDLATALRDEIKQKTGCPCSTGFGGNRLQARLATKRAKPDGQFFLSDDLVTDFMFDIKLKDLPGVGRQTAQKLESLGHQTCGSLQSLSIAALQCHLGHKTGAQLFDQCRGRDANPLIYHTVRKSVSAEVNYGIRFENNDQCIEFLKQLTAEVHSRMQQFKVAGKCITLKLMVRAEEAPVETAKFLGHGFCNVINKSTTLNTATNDIEVITKEVIAICSKQKIEPKEMRGIGIQITKLEMYNSKQTKGSIDRFLCNMQTKVEKHTVQKDILENKDVTDKSRNLVISKTTSPLKKSPILVVAKSPPGKKRGRPPKHVKPKQASNNLMSKFLNGNPIKDTPYRCPMKKENVTEVKPQGKQEQKPQGLLGLSWEEVRELLRAWLESGLPPLKCDINLIIAYMREMVIRRNIDKLNILINFLKRRTRELHCTEWFKMYDQVIEQVQDTMIAVYGKRLFIKEEK